MLPLYASTFLLNFMSKCWLYAKRGVTEGATKTNVSVAPLFVSQITPAQVMGDRVVGYVPTLFLLLRIQMLGKISVIFHNLDCLQSAHFANFHELTATLEHVEKKTVDFNFQILIINRDIFGCQLNTVFLLGVSIIILKLN